MTVITRSALLPYSAQSMFDLVNDVEAYPQYLEGCVGAEVLAADADMMEARLDLQKRGIRHSLVTRNRLHRPTAIDLQLVDGPFRRFAGRWSFEPVGEEPMGEAACKVTLTLEFEFASRLLGFAAGKLFEGLADRMVAAMVARAKDVYGQ